MDCFDYIDDNYRHNNNMDGEPCKTICDMLINQLGNGDEFDAENVWGAFNDAGEYILCYIDNSDSVYMENHWLGKAIKRFLLGCIRFSIIRLADRFPIAIGNILL